jgi:AraC-like DNA-binding protein
VASLNISLERLVLQRVFHYHQRIGCHPTPLTIDPYHEFVELVTGGRGWIEIEGSWREVIPGTLIWNKPGDHTIGRSDFANPYRCLAVVFRTPKRKGLGVERWSICPNLSEVSAFTEEVVKLRLDEAMDPDILRNYIISRLLLWASRHSIRKERTGLPIGLQSALDWMEAHYESPCSIAQIAKQADWSAAYLHHMFRRRLGVTPHQVLLNRRLRAAREKLVSTSHPVKRIAVECGFGDASALIHAFRAHLGVTPKSYRVQHASMVRISPKGRAKGTFA